MKRVSTKENSLGTIGHYLASHKAEVAINITVSESGRLFTLIHYHVLFLNRYRIYPLHKLYLKMSMPCPNQGLKSIEAKIS